MAKKLALTFGIVFVLVGLIGLLGGLGIVGETGFFMTNTVHDWVHLISGIIFLIVAFAAAARSSVTMTVFGVIYLLVALLGFIGNNPVLGFIPVNGADNVLHLILAVVILWGGLSTRKDGAAVPMTPQM